MSTDNKVEIRPRPNPPILGVENAGNKSTGPAALSSTSTENDHAFHQQSTLPADPPLTPADTRQTSNHYIMSFTKPPQTPLTPSFAEFTWEASTPSTPTSSLSESPTLMDFEPQCQNTETAQNSKKPPQESEQRNLLTRRYLHLMRPLAPLLNVETGQAHPRFPRTLLHYHLLTSAELDELAHFYHQRTPTGCSTQYPMPVITRWAAEPDANDRDISPEQEILAHMLGASPDDVAQSNSKRRRFGRFVGLQGMESADADQEGCMREEMERWVEREMSRREERDREREAWRRKGC